MNPSKLFFITGVSSGFGRALAEEALKAGHRVAGTVRNQQAKQEFDALVPGRSTGWILDVTDFDAIAPLADIVERETGPVDVLVNNAGAAVLAARWQKKR
ncbi:SDR family NAD(P)-dependent oxidoreductase [Rahnella inusitata]|uniref:SDR family NAD(P)-dependent oxidoreductase n=1 Tax=Rahnella inusitata TaxID=58169 RepID=UPI0039BE862A